MSYSYLEIVPSIIRLTDASSQKHSIGPAAAAGSVRWYRTASVCSQPLCVHGEACLAHGAGAARQGRVWINFGCWERSDWYHCTTLN